VASGAARTEGGHPRRRRRANGKPPPLPGPARGSARGYGWSIAEPVGAALAGAVVEVVRRGDWPPLVGGIALAVASAVIAVLAVRTLALLARGRLLPPPAQA
jgi:hypothetical protein